MQFSYQQSLPAEFDESSRVWIYQSSRLFSLQEAFRIEEMLRTFVSSWNSHGVPVNGFANLYFGQFIVLMADERGSQVSGCSTDSSVHLMKELEKQFSVQLFDRQLLAFYIKDKVQLLPLTQLASGFAQGLIHADTLYFNNTVLTKKELENNWIIPVKNSWLAGRIAIPRPVAH
jgi:hypothetical protein